MDTPKPSKSIVNGDRDLMLTPVKTANGSIPPNGAPTRGRPANKPGSDSAGISLLSILAAVRRRWPPAIILGCVLAPLFAATGWLALAPKHSATAYLQVELNDAPLAFKTADQEAGGVIAFKIYKNSQKQLITNPVVLQKAITDLQSASKANPEIRTPTIQQVEDPLQWLKESLKVTFPDDSEIMAVELASSSIQESQHIVDAVVKAYMDEVVGKESQARKGRLIMLEEAQRIASENILKERNAIKVSAEVVGTGDPDTLSLAEQTAVQQFGQLQAELNMVNYDLLKAKGLLELTEEQIRREAESRKSLQDAGGQSATETERELGIQISQLEYEQALGKDIEYQDLSSEGREISRKIRELERASFGERMTGPLLEQAQKIRQAMAERREVVMDMVKKDLEMRIASGRLKSTDVGSASTNLLDPHLRARQELEVKILTERHAVITKDLAKIDEQAKKLGRENVEMEMRRAKITSLNEVLTNLQREIETTRIEQGNSDERVKIVSLARAIEGSDPKKRLAATIAGGLFGLALPLIGFVLFDMQKKHLDDPKKLKSELHVDVLGMVPSSKGPIAMLEAPGSKRGRQKYATLVESVNSIVAMLVKKASVDERQIFMVTSAAPSEGKSTLAQNLWNGLCDANYRCLLIDMDFRRPSMHRYLDVEIGLGASDVLSGKLTVSEAIRSLDTNRHYLTAGETRQLNLAAMASDALPKLFDYLRAQYDFIIVDTAPILPVVDSRVIGEHVDGAVLATIRDRSRLPQLIAAIELLKAHDTDILGVVVSGFGSANYGYTYYRS